MKKTPKLRFKEFSGGYKKTQFSDCVSIRNGQVDPCIEPYCDMPHIGPGNMEKFTGRLLEVRTAKEDGQMSGKYLFDKEDVLYGKINPHFGKVVFPKYEGLCSADTYPLKALKGMVSNYLFYSLQTSRFLKYSISVSMRTGMPKINREELSLYNFNLPSMSEQEKIASFFSLIDDKISLQGEKVETLKEYKKGMMQKIFSRELRFKDSDGRDYPEWEDKKLEDLCNIKKGEQLNKDSLIVDGEYYALNGGIDPSGYTDKYNTEANTISISEGGNSCGYINYNFERFWSGGHCYTLEDISECIDNKYLYQFLKYNQLKIMSLRVGSGLPNIQKKDLTIFKVDIPCIEEQLKISSLLFDIDTKIKLEKEKLDSLNEYKKGLLQQMFV